eukprot:1492069-Pyramimonas_sp.AAC.2
MNLRYAFQLTQNKSIELSDVSDTSDWICPHAFFPRQVQFEKKSALQSPAPLSSPECTTPADTQPHSCEELAPVD